jgi:two-component system chemotaxis response regulator CheB
MEATLWVALRIMEERRKLLQKLETDTRNKAFMHVSSGHKRNGQALQQHIDRLKELIFGVQQNGKSVDKAV